MKNKEMEKLMKIASFNPNKIMINATVGYTETEIETTLIETLLLIKEDKTTKIEGRWKDADATFKTRWNYDKDLFTFEVEMTQTDSTNTYQRELQLTTESGNEESIKGTVMIAGAFIVSLLTCEGGFAIEEQEGSDEGSDD